METHRYKSIFPRKMYFKIRLQFKDLNRIFKIVDLIVSIEIFTKINYSGKKIYEWKKTDLAELCSFCVPAMLFIYNIISIVH